MYMEISKNESLSPTRQEDSPQTLLNSPGKAYLLQIIQKDFQISQT